MENINEFNYKSFFDNIDNISSSQALKLIQNETNNFDVFLVCQFFSEFLKLVDSYKIERIKFSNLDIEFSDDIENYLFSDDDSLLSYIHYRLEKGNLISIRVNIKFELTEPIDIKYFINLYNILHYLGTIILNHATKEQLNSTESKPQITEPDPLDLSNTSAVVKIIYLNELGIIDFLRSKPEFISVNLLATFLSAITGEKPLTLQTSLNRLLTNDTADKNHPYQTQKTVNKVRQTLIDKNIKPRTS